MVDCGPGRFAIWRALRNETALCICKELDQVLCERGPVEEMLMDNATTFRSREMADLLREWNVTPFFRAAYRPSRNGIVERHHRTIKALSKRGRILPTRAVFWYNMSPRNGQLDTTIPYKSVHCYEWMHPAVEVSVDSSDEQANVKVGDEVWVKPPSAKCTQQWIRGEVTGVNSRNNVEVDGMSRHVLEIRPVICRGIRNGTGTIYGR
ncbi:Gag-Pro-Pol polyprotein [Elysia marginata]|uniref:Gag-Pro-Pol polyprotein n=1 Tax=Elysia marginata TaxID=1093978 RepID=A0AAV4ENS8_9GAST|nr:Gag-Pro-Pol polyprotein [Elysia marginata]